MTVSHSGHDSRPEFMIVLGLAPPYAKEDVKKAYLDKAKQLHPDHGGSAADFAKLHEAFQQAEAFLEFRGDRRTWIAGKMEHYLALERANERLRELGARIATAAPEWLAQSFGDFAQLSETATIVRAENAANGDEIIAALVDELAALRELSAIELPGCQVTDDAVLGLAVFKQLKRLDLTRTPVTRRVLSLIQELPALESLYLDGSGVGWWDRRRAARRLSRKLNSEA